MSGSSILLCFGARHAPWRKYSILAFDLYLSGEGDRIWGLALVSGLVFLGGLVTSQLIERFEER